MVRYQEKIFTHAAQAIAFISTVSLLEIAFLICFFNFGMALEVIEDAKQYKIDYLNRLKQNNGKTHFLVSDFGKFEIEEIQPPRVIDHALIFYAHRQTDGLPYKVTTPFPHNIDSFLKLTLLPFQQEQRLYST